MEGALLSQDSPSSLTTNMRYVYCLVRDAKGIDTLPPGLGGATVHQILVGQVGALVSDITSADLVACPENALVHHQIVCRALERSSSVLPCRFGVSFEDVDELLAVLADNYPKLEGQLTRLKGKVEMGIRVILDGRAVWEDQAAAQELPHLLTEGERYLLRKKRERNVAAGLTREAQRLAEELHRVTSPFWADVRAETERWRKEELILSVFYLVDREKLSSFKRAYEHFHEASPGLKLLITGSWPAYNFADWDLDRGSGQAK